MSVSMKITSLMLFFVLGFCEQHALARQMFGEKEALSTMAAAPESVEVGFSPDAGGEDLVLKAINSAQKSIRLAAYSFTSAPIIKALVAAKRRGVDIACVLDKSNTKSKSGIAAANLLTSANIAVRIDSQHPIEHNKYIAVDSKTVETGSFNYSAAAAHKNAENAIVLWNDPSLAKAYENNWLQHWSHSDTYHSTY